MIGLQFYRQIPADPPQDGKSLFLDQEITHTAHQWAAAQDITNNCIDNLIARLETWLPMKEHRIVKSLAFLDLCSLPDNMVPDDYGDDEIATVKGHFCTSALDIGEAAAGG